MKTLLTLSNDEKRTIVYLYHSKSLRAYMVETHKYKTDHTDKKDISKSSTQVFHYPNAEEDKTGMFRGKALFQAMRHAETEADLSL